MVDIIEDITQISILYDEINQRWSNDICTTDVYQVYRQKEYREVYEKLKDFNIESLAVKIIADSLNKKVLSRLRVLIQENVRIYETRKDDFSSIDFDTLDSFWEEQAFGNKRAILLNDKELIKDYPYPTERERELLMKENRSDLMQLENERNDFYRTESVRIRKNYYTPIYKLSQSFVSILDSYFPIEQVKEEVPETSENIQAILTLDENPVGTDEIFRTGMFERLQELERTMIEEKYLDHNLHWILKHKNDKPDLQRLVVFISRLIDRDYFLPYKDVKVRIFMEHRYSVKIGQNFGRKRREKIVSENTYMFKELPF